MTDEVHDLFLVTAVSMAPHGTGCMIDLIYFRCTCGVSRCLVEETRKITNVDGYVDDVMGRQTPTRRRRRRQSR